MPADKSEYSLALQYVSQQRGWHRVLICLGIAAVLSLSFRFYFSPERLRPRVEGILKNLPNQYKIEFESLELSLSEGWVPQIGILAKGIQVFAFVECHGQTPGVSVAEFNLPISVRRLIKGEFAIGNAVGRGVVIDVDALKPCGTQTTVSNIEKSVPTVSRSKRIVADPLLDSEPKTFFKESDLARVSNIVEGIEIESLDISFENHRKSLQIKDLVVDLANAKQVLAADFNLHVPESLTYGEALPLIHLHAGLASNELEFTFFGHLSEGHIEGVAKLTNYESGPRISASADVRSVPLSRLIPILSKAQIASTNIDPKFLWLNCRVSVAGQFQGVFKKYPLKFEDCNVEGDAGHISVPNATRLPSGEWRPFTAYLKNIDIARVLEYATLEGPSGIANHFGILSGVLQWESLGRQIFNGDLENAALYFSNFGQWKEQEIKRIQLRIDRSQDLVRLDVPEIDFVGGEFKGDIQADFNLNKKNGGLKFNVRRFNLTEKIQELMLMGKLDSMSMAGDLRFSVDGLTGGQFELGLDKFVGPNLRFDSTRLRGKVNADSLSIQGQMPIAHWHLSKKNNIEDIPIFSNSEAEIKDVVYQIDFEKRRAILRSLKASTPAGQRVEMKGELVGPGKLNLELGIRQKQKSLGVWSLMIDSDHLVARKPN